MDEIKPQSTGTIIESNTKTIVPLSLDEIQIIKNRFNKRKKITWYIIVILFTVGLALSGFMLIYEIQETNRLNRTLTIDELKYSSSPNYGEISVPFDVGTGLALILLLVIVMFNQECGMALQNNNKIIYKGVVTKLSERSSVTGIGKNRNTNYYYYIYLGDISFVHNKLYFELNEGDTIEVHMSEKLGIIFYKNIVKNKAVAEAMPEVIAEHGPILEIKYKQEVKQRNEFMTDDECNALKAQKKKRTKRIIIVGAIITLLMGATAELNLFVDSYSLEDTIAWRIGFWGFPLAFFGLLFYRRTVALSKDIAVGEKIIISEKLINKEESYSDAAKEYTYTLNGIRENIEVSKEIFNSIGPGDDFEIHKTKIRGVFLELVIMKNNIKYDNPNIFKTK
jgi:hypothetical protein